MPHDTTEHRPPPHEGHEPERPAQQGGSGTSPAEWAAAAVSALLVVGAMALMLYEALSEPETPPLISIAVEQVMDVPGGHAVRVRATNRGQSTAAGLVVEGTLQAGARTVEQSTVTIDYLPAEGSRQATLVFTHDPDSFRLAITPRGFTPP